MQHLLRSASRLRKKKKERTKRKKLVVPLCFMFYLTLQNKPLFFFSLLVSVYVRERLFHCSLRAQYLPTIILKVFLRFPTRFG